LESDSNVNDESDWHRSKQDFPRIITEEGIETDLSEVQSQNASDSIRLSLESDLKVNIESDPHRQKQDFPRIVTEEGIQINLSEEHSQNASASI
jgi:hypothetical protein